MNYYIAIDFDGTLCKSKFPEIGRKRHNVFDSLQRRIRVLKALGFKPIIILWTCREDTPERAYLTEAVEWCKDNGLEFDYVNENPLYASQYMASVRKIYADEYWDDKSVKV